MGQDTCSHETTVERWAAVRESYEAFAGRLAEALSSMTDRQRQRAIRLDDGSLGFVEKLVDIASRNPEMLPPDFDLDGLRRDLEARQRVRSLAMDLIHQLQVLQAAHGADAMSAAFDIHADRKTEGDEAKALRLLMGPGFEQATASRPASDSSPVAPVAP